MDPITNAKTYASRPTVARDNLAQDGQKLCPQLDSLILAHTDQKTCLSFSVLDGRKRVR